MLRCSVCAHRAPAISQGAIDEEQAHGCSGLGIPPFVRETPS
jgi:hypothetical protein